MAIPGMKKPNYIIILLCCLLFVFACKKEAAEPEAEEPTPDVPAVLRGKLSAKIDNVLWEADDEVTAILNNSKGENKLWLYGTNKKEELMSLKAMQVTATGTYTYAMNHDENTAQFSRTWTQHYYSLFMNDYTLTITKFDKATRRISGTFSFKAEAAFDRSIIRVTEGTFTDVLYRQQ